MAKSKKSSGKSTKASKSAAGGKPPASSSPPADVPTSSSNTPYILGILLFGGGIVALLYTRCSEETVAPKPTAAQQAPTTKPSGAPVNADLPEFAPPPPPEEDAGPDAAASASAPAPKGTGAPVKVASADGKPAAGPTGACSKCGSGKASSALVSAVRGTAGTAQGCHNRALREGGAQGRMNVSVSVGSNGSVCGASITSDSVGNPALSSCVLSKFRGRSYPKPESGCVVINVPLNFTMK